MNLFWYESFILNPNLLYHISLNAITTRPITVSYLKCTRKQYVFNCSVIKTKAQLLVIYIIIFVYRRPIFLDFGLIGLFTVWMKGKKRNLQ
jgi:hypothetical protein